jgi:hypothetical protein
MDDIREELTNRIQVLLDSQASNSSFAVDKAKLGSLDKDHPFTGLVKMATPPKLNWAKKLRELAPLWDHLSDFRSQVREFARVRMSKIPGWRFGDESEPVPVNLENPTIRFHVFPGRSAISVPASVRTFSFAWARYRSEHKTQGPVLLGLDAGKGVFARLFAKSFSTVAISPTSPTRLYTVHSQAEGYRIHWTYQFWLSPVVFGRKLSTPVKGYLSHGCYRFGGNKGANPITWDDGNHTVSSTSPETNLTRI